LKFLPPLPWANLSYTNIPSTKSHNHFLSLRSFIHSIRTGPRPFVTFCNKLIFYGEELLTPRPTPSWRSTPCRLSATAYSVYSQLPSISGGRVLQRNLKTRHAVVTRDPPNMALSTLCNIDAKMIN
jgi:hypothetical protein